MNLSQDAWFIIALLGLASVSGLLVLLLAGKVRQYVSLPEARRKRLVAITWCLGLLTSLGAVAALVLFIFFTEKALSESTNVWTRSVGITTTIVVVVIIMWSSHVWIALLKAKPLRDMALGIGEYSSTTSPRVKR